MKNIFKTIMSLVLIVSVNSCSNSNNVIDEVLEYETGAVLRTLEVLSNTLNSSDPSTAFSVSVEEQDGQDGALFAAVNVHVTMRDLTPDNGTTVREDVLVKSIPASEFSPGPHGLPRGIVSATYGEAFSAMGLSANDVFAGDIFVFVLKLELTDGRVYDDTNAGGSITGGFFASPFRYNALIVCSPEPGDYTIDMQDLYGDGWQGSAVRMNLDGSPVDVSIPDYWACPADCGSVGDAQWSSASDTITIPNGTVEGTWEYVAGAWPGEVVFQIYAPDNSLLGDFGPSQAPGLLPVTLCAN